MPPKRKTTVRRRRPARRGMRGHGFFGDLWSGVKSAASAIPWRRVGEAVNDGLKSSRFLSNNLGKIPVIGDAAANLAREQGYGRRRRGRGQIGGAMANPSLYGASPVML